MCKLVKFVIIKNTKERYVNDNKKIDKRKMRQDKDDNGHVG